MEIILNIVLFITLLSLFNLVRYMLKIRKVMQMHKDNPDIKGISIINGEIKVIEHKVSNTESEKEQLVVDDICGKEVNRKEAYCVSRNGKEYYFCSWECRQEFLASVT